MHLLLFLNCMKTDKNRSGLYAVTHCRRYSELPKLERLKFKSDLRDNSIQNNQVTYNKKLSKPKAF